MTHDEKLEQALGEMASREVVFEEALMDDAIAEHAYKVEKANAFLRAEGTEKAREAESIVKTDALFLVHLKAKAVVTFAKEKLKDVQQAVSARQTLVSAGRRGDNQYSHSGPG